jgi:hypothetical protein
MGHYTLPATEYLQKKSPSLEKILVVVKVWDFFVFEKTHDHDSSHKLFSYTIFWNDNIILKLQYTVRINFHYFRFFCLVGRDVHLA